MGTTSSGKPVATTGTSTIGNTSGSPVAQQQGKIVKGGGAGASSASKKNNKAKCTKAGHPVDVVTGEVIDDAVDLMTPGAFAVLWKRIYSSAFADEATPLGRGGWSFTLNQWFEPRDGKLVHRNEDGRDLEWPAVDPGGVAFDRGKRLELRRRGATFEVYSLDTRLTRVFSCVNGDRTYLTEIHDRRGNRVVLHYAGHRLETIVDTAKREYRLTHDGAGRIVRVSLFWAKDRVHQHVDYGYTDSDELGTVTDALGQSESFDYDGYHRMVRTTLKNGIHFHYIYDDAARCVKTWGDGGLFTVELTFDEDARTTTLTGTPEARRYTYDARNAIIREETLDGALAMEREFDADLLLLVQRNGAGEELRNEWDGRGNLIRQTDAAGNVTECEYVDDVLVKRTAPGGRVTRFERDQHGDLLALVKPSGVVYRGTWDARGHLEGVYSASGELVRAEHDPEHNQTRSINGRGGGTTYTYDALGRPLSRTDPLGRTTRLEYDVLGRAVAVIQASGGRIEMAWDALDYCLRHTNALGQTVAFAYSGLGAMTSMTLPSGLVWRFTYDRDQRLLWVENPKAERYEFTYDRAGRIVEQRTFDARTISFQWNRADRLARVQQPDGSWRGFAYDPLGNLLEESSPHGSAIFERDERGIVQRAVLDEYAGKTVVEYERDELDRIVIERQNEHVIARTYDANGWCATRAVDAEEPTQYHYDPYGFVSAVDHHGQRVLFERDVIGREIRKHFYRGKVDVVSQLGPLDELLEQRVLAPSRTGDPTPTTLEHRTYQYDLASQLLSVTDTRWGATRFGYGPDGDLLSAERGQQRDVFDYDAAGSVVQILDGMTPAAQTWSVAQGNVLRRTEDAEYEYDENRRRIRKQPLSNGRPSGGATEYVWDCRDRLREVRLATGARLLFMYDAFGRRVRKEVIPPPPQPGKPVASPPKVRVIEIVWDGAVPALELDTERGKRGFVFEPGTFVPLLQEEHGESFAYVVDHLGTPRELVDSDGRIAWAAAYSAWGQLTESKADPASKFAGKVSTPFRRLGHYHDEETGLDYVRHRYFDPEVARWISGDPLLFHGGSNLFGVDGAPTVEVDPTGLANHGDIGTYGDLKGGPDNKGDNMDADEMLLNAFIQLNADKLQPGYDYGGRGVGNASNENPSIALEGRTPFPDGTHAQVFAGERDAGLHNPEVLAGMTAAQVIDEKAKILQGVLAKEFGAAAAKKMVAKLKKEALAHARRIFPICVSG